MSNELVCTCFGYEQPFEPTESHSFSCVQDAGHLTEKEKALRQLLIRVFKLSRSHLPMMAQAGNLIEEACMTGMSELELNTSEHYQGLRRRWEEEDKQAQPKAGTIELHTNGALIPYMDGVTRVGLSYWPEKKDDNN
jgi:hypothetical protein